VIICGLVLCLAGCSTTSIYAAYKHPSTGEVLECEKAPPGGGVTGVYGLGDAPIVDKYNKCKSSLERHGYERMGTLEREQMGRPKSELAKPIGAK
jgi:hypothetical protein